MVNTIFILDEQFKTRQVLTINGKNTFFDDLYVLDISTCTETYEFSTNSEVDETNYIMFYYHNQYKLFTVIEIEQEHSNGEIVTTCYCECTALELLNNVVRTFKGEYNCISFFEHILKDTGWQIGTYSSSLKEKVIGINVDKTTQIWTCIQEHMTKFGYEINTRVKYDNGHVKAKIIDVFQEGQLGEITCKRFEYGRNVSGITKKKDLYEFCTALVIDTDEDVTQVEYNKDGYEKEKNSDVLLATNENKEYNYGRAYIYGTFKDSDSQSATEVVSKAVEELKRRATPHFDYEVTTAMSFEEYENINLGDTVYVIDHTFNPIVTLEAKIGELEISFTDRASCRCKLTNYKEIKSKTTRTSDENVKEIVESYFPVTSEKIAAESITSDKIYGSELVGVSLKSDDNSFEVNTGGDQNRLNVGKQKTQNGATIAAFSVSQTGDMKIGGYSAHVHSDNYRKGVAEITAEGTIYSCSKTDPNTYTQITEGAIRIYNGGYDAEHGDFLDKKIVMENGEFYITSYSDDNHTTRKKEIAILGNTIYSNMYDNITFEDNVYVEGIVKATSVSQTSDRTMKENIKYISNANTISSDGITIDDCYRFIKNELPLATYNYINHSDKKIGFVLQDILCYIDGTDNKIGQLITTQLKYSQENDKLTYDTNNLFGVMLGAMQVMANEIESLKNKLNE